MSWDNLFIGVLLNVSITPDSSSNSVIRLPPDHYMPRINYSALLNLFPIINNSDKMSGFASLIRLNVSNVEYAVKITDVLHTACNNNVIKKLILTINTMNLIFVIKIMIYSVNFYIKRP